MSNKSTKFTLDQDVAKKFVFNAATDIVCNDFTRAASLVAFSSGMILGDILPEYTGFFSGLMFAGSFFSYQAYQYYLAHKRHYIFIKPVAEEEKTE